MRARLGFTLIELLVVIAIIAILAAILFPVFLSAQQAARKATCQADMKEICQGAMLYEDNYGTIMPACVDHNNSGSCWDYMSELWVGLLDPYLRQLRMHTQNQNADIRGVFKCPASPNVYIKSSGARDATLDRAYGYNYYYLGGNPNDPASTVYHKNGEVVAATKTIRVLENWNYNNGVYSDYRPGGRGSMVCYPPQAVTNYCAPNQVWPPGWHAGASTVGWMDGHVSMIKCCKPQPPGAPAPPNPYSGIMQKTYNDDGNTTNHADPWFRLSNPKP